MITKKITHAQKTIRTAILFSVISVSVLFAFSYQSAQAVSTFCGNKSGEIRVVTEGSVPSEGICNTDTYASNPLQKSSLSTETQTSVSELVKLIEKLKEQIDRLSKEVPKTESKKPTTPVTPVVTGKCFGTWTQNMGLGSNGSDVTRLQQMLNNDLGTAITGLDDPDNFGYFGNLTESAVKRFQAKYGIVTSGSPETTGYGAVGPTTRAFLAKGCNGSSNEDSDLIVKTLDGNETHTGVEATFTRGSSCSPYTITWGDGEKTEYKELKGVDCPQVTVKTTLAHTYKNGDTYTVTLKQGDKTASKKITIKKGGNTPPPADDADFDLTLKVSPSNVVEATFTRGSSCSGYTINWGDNTPSLAVDPPAGLSCAQVTVKTTLSHTYSVKGTYTVSVTMNGKTDSKKVTISSIPDTAVQKVAIDGYNIYSPETIVVGNKLHVYFGGWMKSDQVNDVIYRTICDKSGKNCSTPKAVVDSNALGFEHFNDPSIVKLKDASNREYFLMYLTGVKDGENGLVASNNHIYYTTSWADDGLTWEVPRLLVSKHWLPSATVNKKGEVELYANDNSINGRVVRLNMSKSGIDLIKTEQINYGVTDNYSNPHIQYMPKQDMYYIIAERATPTNGIDAFSSADGLTWKQTNKDIVKTESGQVGIGSPAFSTENPRLIFFGSTADSNWMNFKIRSLESTSLNPFDLGLCTISTNGVSMCY